MLQLTYTMPDYDSAHATEGGAAAEVLTQFFGTDDIAFTACGREGRSTRPQNWPAGGELFMRPVHH